ncbi:tyrosine-protein phosphatase non-receptor type 6 [Colletotrichum graminicola]|nr:tyrosine-protein phosphatase non-receptor type 6 [Colletotrichum graminicola]
MTDEARAHAEALIRASNQALTSSREEDVARRSQYEKLLAQIDDEGRVSSSSSLNQSTSPDRAHAKSQHELDLESEFRRRVPDLYRKILDVHGNSGGMAAEPSLAAHGAGTETAIVASEGACHPVGAGGDEDKDRGGDRDSTTATFEPDMKAPLVEYLDREPTTNAPRMGLSKLTAEDLHGYFDSAATLSTASDDSYVKVAKGEGQQVDGHPSASPDPGHHHRQDRHAGFGGEDGTRDAAAVGGPLRDETPRKGGGGFFNKVLRRA